MWDTRGMMWRRALVWGLLGLVGVSWGQLTEREIQGLSDSLYLANFTLDDLKTERSPFRAMGVSDWVRDGMSDPVKQAGVLMEAHRAAIGGDARIGFEALFGASGIRSAAFNETAPPAGMTDAPEPIVGALLPLAQDMARADLMIREAFAKLSAADQRVLVESLPTLAIGQSRVKLGFVRGETVSVAEAAQLMESVDLDKIAAAGVIVESATKTAVVSLRALKLDFVGKRRFIVNGLPVVVAGIGADLHDETDARITIDLGGNDLYRGRHGAGVGYSSVLIDLAGDDDYRVPDLSIGAGILGVGVAIDAGGNDRFSGQSLNFGCGIAGVGILSKSGGEDRYELIAAGQGFGMFGIGMLLDSGGDDLYKIGLLGQGAGRTKGLGWLVDRGGDDVYQAGGVIVNAPLFDDVHYSQAQGFGFGFRDDAGGVPGGVGMLTDGAGRDSYLAETYAQASSYWFGVGSLYDLSGNDLYRAHHYAQGSAMHLTSAFLFDLAGADAYVTQWGAAQGIGHDYGLALFLDRSGNDVYASQDARPGTGVSNGIGIFIESAGSDRYSTTPGFGRVARAMMSLGVFVDLEGGDFYPADLRDDLAVVEPGLSIRNDAAGIGAVATAERPRITPGSKPFPGAGEMKRIYDVACGWRVGSSQAAVDGAIDELIAIGTPAFEWMLENRLATVNRLEVRAWAQVANGIGEQAIAGLGRKALGGTDAEIEAVVRIGGEGRIVDVGAILPRIIQEKPAMRDLAIRTAGTLKARGCVEVILPLLFEADDITKRTIMACLAEIGDPASVGTAANYINSNDPFVRDAAVRLVLSNPQQAESLGKVLYQDVDEKKARMGVVILARLDMFNSLDLVGQALSDPRPGVRITALIELNGKCPPAYREAFLGLLRDPIPSVARVARTVRP